MSPVSRGRKGKKNKKQQEPAAKQPVELGELGEPEDLGLGEMMAEVVARIAEFEHVDDPVDGEYLAAGLLAVGYGESADYGEVFARLFIDEARKLSEPGALAFLRCIAVLTPEPVRSLAREAAQELVSAGVDAPAWVSELEKPLTAGEFVRWSDADGAGHTLFGSFDRAGRSDGFLVFVDDENCGAAYDLAPFVGEGLTEARQLTDEQEPADAEPMTAEDFRWQVQAALDARMVHDRGARELGIEWDEPEDEDSIPHEVVDVVVRARLEALPLSVKMLPVHVHPEFELDLQ